MFEAYAYLLTRTCELEVFGQEGEDRPVLVMKTHFQDRELCDWLVAHGVRTILLRDNDDPGAVYVAAQAAGRGLE